MWRYRCEGEASEAAKRARRPNLARATFQVGEFYVFHRERRVTDVWQIWDNRPDSPYGPRWLPHTYCAESAREKIARILAAERDCAATGRNH